MVIATAMSLCVVSLPASLSADTLILRDGTQVEGTIVAFAARTITFRDANGVSRKYAASRVEAVEFPEVRRGNPRGTSGRTLEGPVERTDPRAGMGGRSLEAPVGTALIVRTVETIDSRNAGANQTFSAIVEQNVNNASGRVIVPERSTARLMIRHMSSGGATGGAEMILDVQSITVDGRRYTVSTTDLTLENDTGIGKNKRTAEVIGGGAALGTIIGGIAGGGKGAAIGVLVGAAGGAGAQVLTRGRDVRVPAETVLEFRLDKPVTLQPER
jgi:hypothetical protein